jgi:hypothetical protein
MNICILFVSLRFNSIFLSSLFSLLSLTVSFVSLYYQAIVVCWWRGSCSRDVDEWVRSVRLELRSIENESNSEPDLWDVCDYWNDSSNNIRREGVVWELENEMDADFDFLLFVIDQCHKFEFIAYNCQSSCILIQWTNSLQEVVDRKSVHHSNRWHRFYFFLSFSGNESIHPFCTYR